MYEPLEINQHSQQWLDKLVKAGIKYSPCQSSIPTKWHECAQAWDVPQCTQHLLEIEASSKQLWRNKYPTFMIAYPKSNQIRWCS